jgi:hypothetical protein
LRETKIKEGRKEEGEGEKAGREVGREGGVTVVRRKEYRQKWRY